MKKQTKIKIEELFDMVGMFVLSWMITELVFGKWFFGWY